MRILNETPKYNEAQCVAYKKDGKQLIIELKAPGYTKDSVSVTKDKEGIHIIGKPCKDAGKGEFAPGFANCFPITEPKQYDFAKVDNLVKLEDGILTVIVPIAKEFQAVEFPIN